MIWHGIERNKKHSTTKRKASQVRYTAERRWETNKARRVAREMARQSACKAVRSLASITHLPDIGRRRLAFVTPDEWAAMRDMAETNRDNQLLLQFEQYGLQVSAKRHSVSERTIRDWQTLALNRKAICRTASA